MPRAVELLSAARRIKNFLSHSACILSLGAPCVANSLDMLPPLLQTMRENSMNGWQAQIPDAMASLLLASYSPMAYASSPSMVAPPHLPPPYHNMPMSYAHNMGCAMASQRLSSGPSPLPFSLRPLRSELSFPHGLAGTPSRPMSRPEVRKIFSK